MKDCIAGAIVAALAYCAYAFWDVIIEHWVYSIVIGYLPVGVFVSRLVHLLDETLQDKDDSYKLVFWMTILWPVTVFVVVLCIVVEIGSFFVLSFVLRLLPILGHIHGFITTGNFIRKNDKEVI